MKTVNTLDDLSSRYTIEAMYYHLNEYLAVGSSFVVVRAVSNR